MIDLNFLIDPMVYEELISAGIVLSLFIVIAFVVRYFFKRHVHKLSKITETTLDDELIHAVERPIYIGILAWGLYASLGYLSFLKPYNNTMDAGFKVFLIAIAAFVVARALNGFIAWYIKEVAAKTKSTFDDKYVPALKKVVLAVIYGIAAVIILGELGVEITPLIASLGIGGLAVALALQDTIANFFAGAYIVADKPIRPGDYIEVEGGHMGYVEEIGWRSTRIKTLPNNIIVIPNSKLAQSIITNYYGPTQEMSVVVPVGVSYSSDLDKVEKVTVEVAREILKNIEGGVKSFEPVIRYNEFGEYSIKFSVTLRVKEYSNKYLITHEFIKALKKRYDKEGIEIPYPTRTVIMKK